MRYLSLALAAMVFVAVSIGQSPYQKWLDEDVVYIITATERQAFQQLANDAEREAFMRQFWERRNSTPGHSENPFKEEHYRRIAYANERFAAGIPGWKTDRGRIYIVFGPPDEIESHPSGGGYERPTAEGGGQIVTYPFERWLYRQPDGGALTFEFVDPNLTGEYRLAADHGEKQVRPKPGGGVSITVEVLTGGVVISSPLCEAAPCTIYGRITNASNRVLQVFEEPLSRADQAYRKIVALPSGAYHLTAVIKDRYGRMSQQQLAFEVN